MPATHKKFTTFSLLNVKTVSDRLSLYFKNAEKLHLIHFASSSNYNHNDWGIVTYLNIIHPYLIHIIGDYESSFLNTLSNEEQKNLIEQLSTNSAQYFIFENQDTIPTYFLRQDKIHIVVSNHPAENVKQHLAPDINEIIAERKSLHGAFLVVFNKGILITGESGVGKSSLLLDLVKQGHLWIADDLSLFFIDHNNQIIGQGSNELSEFIHIKGIGPVNMDKSHGQACRIRSHPLAAVIHLSNNRANNNSTINAYAQTDTITLFNKAFPMWHLSTAHTNLTTMVENCAKNLILNDWNYNATNGLDNALNNALTINKPVTSREV